MVLQGRWPCAERIACSCDEAATLAVIMHEQDLP